MGPRSRGALRKCVVVVFFVVFVIDHAAVVEQLPLTIHRQLSLMRQLDEQSQSMSCNYPVYDATG